MIAPLSAPGSSPAYGCADFLGGLGARKAHVLRTVVIADPASPVVELLRRQTARFQPDGDHATIDAAQPPCGRMLPGSRGLRLDVTEVRAKSEYGPQTRRAALRHRPPAHRARTGPDASTAARRRRRPNRIGTWKA